MRLILSRKGMDSSFLGGIPSPILPDGRLVSLPIPEHADHAADKGIPYSRIRRGDENLGELIVQLTHGRIGAEAQAHLDPDLDAGATPRQPGWLPTFGQAAAAESHLARNGIGEGDLFLFFGWFRQTCRVSREDRWSLSTEWPGQVRLETVGRGQEFVIHLPESEETRRWLAGIFNAVHPLG